MAGTLTTGGAAEGAAEGAPQGAAKGAQGASDGVAARRRLRLADLPLATRADGATLACLFAIVQLIIPARLVFRMLPLSITPANAVALLAALCWMCAQLTITLGMAKGRTPARSALFVYMTAMLATYGYATWGYLPLDELDQADHGLVLTIANVGIALLVCDGVRDVKRLDLILKSVVVAGAIVSIIAAFQFMLDVDLTRWLELPVLRYTSEDAFIIERADMRRVAATTGHPIELGVVTSMILPLAAHYGFQAIARKQPYLRWWLCTALIGMGLMFSISRSAMLGAAGVGLVLLLGWPGRRRLQMLGVAAGFFLLVWAAFPGLLRAIFDLFANLGNDESISYRTHDYAVAVAQIGSEPFLGRGFATWYAPKHQIFDNQYILTAVENGLIGLAAYVALFVCAFYSALRARRLSADPGTRDLGLTIAACMVVPMIGSATFDLLSFATVTGLSFLLVGASGALLRAVQAPSQASGPTVEVIR